MKEIKPCPFCGSEGRIGFTGYMGLEFTRVKCSDEFCLASGPIRRTDDDAIEVWNRAWELKAIKDLSHELELKDGMDD